MRGLTFARATRPQAETAELHPPPRVPQELAQRALDLIAGAVPGAGLDERAGAAGHRRAGLAVVEQVLDRVGDRVGAARHLRHELAGRAERRADVVALELDGRQ